MNEDVFNVIMSILPVLGAIVTYYVVPYIRANVDSVKLTQCKEWVTLAVKTAEILWPEAGCGEAKKSYVVNFLTELINSQKMVITEDQMNVLIESAVKEMKEYEKLYV